MEHGISSSLRLNLTILNLDIVVRVRSDPFVMRVSSRTNFRSVCCLTVHRLSIEKENPTVGASLVLVACTPALVGILMLDVANVWHVVGLLDSTWRQEAFRRVFSDDHILLHSAIALLLRNFARLLLGCVKLKILLTLAN